MPRALHVLLVEDSEPDATLLVRELRRGGYDPTAHRVDTRDNLRTALFAEPWDIVLSDYSMPQFNALDALSVLNDLKLDVPFVVVSGTIGEETAVEAMRAGAKDFVVKDQHARLVPIIDREVREARLRRERISERRRNEEERERLLTELREAVVARDTLLSMVSHELRTPLSSLELQLELFRRRGIPAMSPDMIEQRIAVITRPVMRLRTLVENLIDVALIASNRLTLIRERVELDELVRQVVAESQAMIGHTKSEVTVQAEPVVGEWDHLRIQSVVANLISNALKFGDGKPITVTVSGNASKARVTVTDRGIGLSPEQQIRIFEKFERAVSEWHYGGLGLGLWVTRQIVEAHQGTIAVASELGKGSTFVVELPFNRR